MGNNKWAHKEWAMAYDCLAQKEKSEVCASGRYSLIGKAAILLLEEDVGRKLRLNTGDELLDLGCGTGLISINLSKKIKSVVGGDIGHEVLLRLNANCCKVKGNIDPVQLDIINLPFKNESFSKVLCYSVAMCFQDYADFKNALVEMLRVCRPGGLVLVGDIPEKNKKETWIKGARRQGEPLLRYLFRRLRQKIIQFRYRISIRQLDRSKAKLNITSPQVPGILYDAETILRICREIGVKGHVLDQPGSLPFGNTRVDLLVEK